MIYKTHCGFSILLVTLAYKLTFQLGTTLEKVQKIWF